NIFFGISTADGKYQNRILRVDPTSLEPFRKSGVPAFIVGASGQLRDVICRRIGFKLADFSKIIYGMTCMASRSAYSQDKKPSSLVSAFSQAFREPLYSACVQLMENFDAFFDEVLSEALHNWNPAASASRLNICTEAAGFQ